MSKAIQFLKGVGPVRVRQLSRLGLNSISDLVYHFPRQYSYRPLVKIGDIATSAGAIVRGKIISTPKETKRKVNVLTVTIADDSGSVRCTWFNQAYLRGQLTLGREITIAGRFSQQYGNIVVEEFEFGDLPQIHVQYDLTEGITNQVMSKIIGTALAEHKEEELLPDSFRHSHNLMDIINALAEVHRPTSRELLIKARYSIKFRELFLYQLSFLYWRNLKLEQSGQLIRPTSGLKEKMESGLGFQFTADQIQVISEIESDMAKTAPMNRLLQGDVGSGKTAVAAFAMMSCAANGFKAAMMVPTEILAQQQHRVLIQASQGEVPVHILTGSTPKSERRKILADLASPGAALLIGTHAVFQEGVLIQDLTLAVTDEQHRFGVEQRLSLTKKGENPHLLVMSATPIPRTMAMTLYGDLDVSTIKNKPGGRKSIKTYVVNSKSRTKIFKFIIQEIEKGNVGYIVCPLIEESEKIQAHSLETYQRMLEQALPDWCKYGLLHGKMSSAEKDAAVESLRNGEYHLLLSTTVVEVGVDVGNATFMVIENSERFGLAQLHQLRGRVGRRDKQSYCFLVTDGTETGRLKILEETNDGFAVALADLKFRGSGQILGNRQHGINEFKLADIGKDQELVKTTRAAAVKTVEILESSPDWGKLKDVVIGKIENLKS